MKDAVESEPARPEQAGNTGAARDQHSQNSPAVCSADVPARPDMNGLGPCGPYSCPALNDAVEVFHQSLQQIGDVAVTFTVGRVR